MGLGVRRRFTSDILKSQGRSIRPQSRVKVRYLNRPVMALLIAFSVPGSHLHVSEVNWVSYRIRPFSPTDCAKRHASWGRKNVSTPFVISLRGREGERNCRCRVVAPAFRLMITEFSIPCSWRKHGDGTTGSTRSVPPRSPTARNAKHPTGHSAPSCNGRAESRVRHRRFRSPAEIVLRLRTESAPSIGTRSQSLGE